MRDVWCVLGDSKTADIHINQTHNTHSTQASRACSSTSNRFASTLVVADHDNATLNAATLSVVSAAGKVGGDVTVLVAGSGCGAVAEQAAAVAGVSKVLTADNEVMTRL